MVNKTKRNCKTLLYRSSQWRCSENYLFCSYQEGKFRNVARKLNIFKEHLLGGLFVYFNDFYRDFSCRITITILPGSRIFLQNTSKFSQKTWKSRTYLYRLNRLKFVNYMKNSSCRTPPKLPGAKHRENTCFVYVARWLLWTLQ